MSVCLFLNFCGYCRYLYIFHCGLFKTYNYLSLEYVALALIQYEIYRFPTNESATSLEMQVFL